jgi:hypothetical protein
LRWVNALADPAAYSFCTVPALGIARGAIDHPENGAMSKLFQDKVVLVTGASSGIGRATAVARARVGITTAA